MPYITLVVTSKVVQHVAGQALNQRQIAIRGASSDLQPKINLARKDSPIVVPIDGEFGLMVGDTGAIWQSHQRTDLQRDNFASLYDLLARRPDKAVSFLW